MPRERMAAADADMALGWSIPNINGFIGHCEENDFSKNHDLTYTENVLRSVLMALRYRCDQVAFLETELARIKHDLPGAVAREIERQLHTLTLAEAVKAVLH